MYASYRPAGKDGDFNAYILRSYRKDDGSTSTETLRKLGRLSKIARENPGVEPREWVESLAAKLTEEENAERGSVTLKLSPVKRIGSDPRRLLHGGDLLLQDLFGEMGLDSICAEIQKRGRFQFDIAAIDLCYTAAGFYDAYWELNLNRWDVAAGALIAKEAGATVESIREDRNHSLLAAAPNLIQDFRNLLLPPM